METNLLHSITNLQDDVFYMEPIVVAKEVQKIIDSAYFEFNKSAHKRIYGWLVDFKMSCINNTQEENDLEIYKLLKRENAYLDLIKTNVNYSYE